MDIKITTPHVEPLMEALKEYPDRVPLTISIRRQKSRRSIDQNRLYWMWLRCLSDETGHTENELHDYFKQAFIGGHYRRIFGVRVTSPATTTTLNTAEFTQYLDKVNAFAAQELGVTLPQPNSGNWWEFYARYM